MSTSIHLSLDVEDIPHPYIPTHKLPEPPKMNIRRRSPSTSIMMESPEPHLRSSLSSNSNTSSISTASSPSISPSRAPSPSPICPPPLSPSSSATNSPSGSASPSNTCRCRSILHRPWCSLKPTPVTAPTLNIPMISSPGPSSRTLSMARSPCTPSSPYRYHSSHSPLPSEHSPTHAQRMAMFT